MRPRESRGILTPLPTSHSCSDLDLSFVRTRIPAPGGSVFAFLSYLPGREDIHKGVPSTCPLCHCGHTDLAQPSGFRVGFSSGFTKRSPTGEWRIKDWLPADRELRELQNDRSRAANETSRYWRCLGSESGRQFATGRKV